MQSTGSSSSEAAPTPPPLDKSTQQELSCSPQLLTFTADLPESSSSSRSSPPKESLVSPDSPTVTKTSESAQSSIASQQEPLVTLSSAVASEDTPEVSSNPPVISPTTGYKLVIDNVDKTIKPRNPTIDAQTQSLHYVQVYAVEDRVDYSKLSSSSPSRGASVYSMIPTTADYQILKDNFNILVARVVVEYIPYFADDFKGLTVRHIIHDYSRETAKKSDVVGQMNYTLSVAASSPVSLIFPCMQGKIRETGDGANHW